MRIVFYLFVAIVLVGAVSCRSSRVETLPTSSSTYTKPTDTLTSSAPVSATLPGQRDSAVISQPLDSTMLRQPVSTAAYPDNPLRAYGKPDRNTTIVNVTGVVVAGIGVVRLVQAGQSANSGTPWGGLGGLIIGVTGLIALLVGIALLFAQGKNGRVRRLREDRRRAQGKI